MRPAVEVGWVLIKPMHRTDREAVADGLEKLNESLQRCFPRFAFRFKKVGEYSVSDSGITIIEAMERGARERESKRLDFVFLLTGLDLRAVYGPSAMAATSQTMACAILSTYRIDPEYSEGISGSPARTESLVRRLQHMGLHAFALLNGVRLPSETTPADPQALDEPVSWTDVEQDKLASNLALVADPRVEEQEQVTALGFYLRALWAHPGQVLSTLGQFRPWLLPFRMSRLTAAAFSALLIFMATAEVWQLGLRQRLPSVFAMSATVWLGTSAFIIVRNDLFSIRRMRRSEHSVQLQTSVTLLITLGMFTLYLSLFIVSFTVGQLLYARALLESWAPSIGEVTWVHRVQVSGIVASLGLLVGALGATFEAQTYFRHVAKVDAEF
ncbi:MAG: hypothetical protein ACFB9M_17805 [Myxococcota bacterium]